MITKFIEATDATEFNYGKFMVARHTTDEWRRPAIIGGSTSLLRLIGTNSKAVLVFDLQTGEGASFVPGNAAKYDLDKHKIWVCPMYEPFLEWLYKQDLTDITALPSIVNLGEVPTAFRGYRREGKASK